MVVGRRGPVVRRRASLGHGCRGAGQTHGTTLAVPGVSLTQFVPATLLPAAEAVLFDRG